MAEDTFRFGLGLFGGVGLAKTGASITQGVVRTTSSLTERLSLRETLVSVDGMALNGADASLVKNNAGSGPFFEVLAESPISGSSRSAHRARANRNFADQLRADLDFAGRENNEFGVAVLSYMESARSGLLNPPGTEWHHPKTDPNSMWLLRRNVHRDPALQNYLHGGGSGGFADYYGQ
ncbi:hypothetical protein [Pseudomonas sp. SDI]|uniref:hypothetical protein n=1 Tax=Pseudomonas sp. SDI TaxID=2170734 RepID=UPI0014023532|nr:hypothetical protein [Pseudomonas sp. SDI]